MTKPLFDLALASPKNEPTLIGDDERHLAAVATTLSRAVTDLEARLAEELRAPGGAGQAATVRDEEIHRLSARLRSLQRFGADLCLGSMTTPTGTTYVGRLGLFDADGAQLLVDWRAPAAEPFFGATHGNPMGLARRRRYRWTRDRVTDFWDEVYDGSRSTASDDQSAFIASLASNRTAQMRDVLGTIAADQDAIIRAGSAGTLVVDGGPGTGKTSSPCTVPRTCSTRTSGSVSAAAACFSSGRTSPTWPTSRTSCPGSARTACGWRRCTTSWRRTASQRPTRRWPA